MKKQLQTLLAIGLVFFTASGASQALNAGARAASDERVLNGLIVDGVVRQAPWVLSLRSNNRHICGASFVSPMFVNGKIVGWSSDSNQPKWAITAAHCVTKRGTDKLVNAAELTVQSGALNIQTSPIQGEIQKVLKIFIPDGTASGPDYNPNTLEDDIAILRLSDSTENINASLRKSIKLPTTIEVDFTHRPYTAVHTAGWGRTSEGGVGSPDLQEVRLPMVDRETCAQKYAPFGDKITTSMLCSGHVSGEYDSCQGDSGSSLFYRPTALSDVLNQPVLVGVVSWGRGCGRSDLFGIYSNIAYLQDWIIDTIEAN